MRIDREQEQRQFLTETMLALVSAGFAVPQVVDKTVAGEVLELLGFGAPAGGYCVWWLLLVQVVAIVVCAPLVALLVLWVARLAANRRRG